eukprot:8443543-Ditylum_brightwellii.AAC.1
MDRSLLATLYQARDNRATLFMAKPSGTKIGQQNSMVRNVMREFKLPIQENDWAQKWCADVHNIASSRKLHWRSPLEM